MPAIMCAATSASIFVLQSLGCSAPTHQHLPVDVNALPVAALQSTADERVPGVVQTITAVVLLVRNVTPGAAS